MSTSQSYSQLSRAFVLDFHTRHFFDTALWEGRADAISRLEEREFAGRVFRGRVMPTLRGSLYLVLQDASSVGGDCLLANIGLPAGLMPAHRLSSTEHIAAAVRAYFEKNLLIALAERDADVVPLLRHEMVSLGLKRLHFDTRTGFGLEFSVYVCNIMRLGAAKCPPIRVELEDGWLAPEETCNGVSGLKGDSLGHCKAFAAMEGEAFHARVESMIGGADSELGETLRLVSMDEEGRSFEVFGCALSTLESALEMLRLSLLIEMGEGGACEVVESAVWHPWAQSDGEEIECLDGAGNWMDFEIPFSLRLWQDAIAARLGCAFRADHLGESALDFAQKWAHGFEATVSRPSQHEVVEAHLKLNEMMK